MIKEAKNNVLKFHEYVKFQLNTLSAKGETSTDIIINLLTGYLACTNKKFTDYKMNIKKA
jgi:hypothetical protein